MGFDFENIKNVMKERLSLVSEWGTILFFGINERMIDAVAYILNKFTVYNEYLLRESKWTLMKNRSSIVYQTPYLNYIPSRKKGATGYVEISTDANFNALWTENSFTIPEWSSFTLDDKNFFTVDDYSYSSADGNSKFFEVVQGTPKEIFYTAVGSLNEEIEIVNASVDNEYIKVYSVIDEVNKVYAEIETTTNLYTITDDELLVCEIYNDYEYTKTIIKFGDNINGRSTISGERFRIVYSETLGDEGNIYITGDVTINFTIQDALEADIPLYARTQNYIDGGQDIESVDEIKLNAPRLFQTGYRCGSKNDWETILLRHQYIGKVFVYGEYELYKAILMDKTETQAIADGDLTTAGRVPNADNVVVIVALTASGNDLTTIQKDAITQIYLRGEDGTEEPKVSPTTWIAWQDPEIIDIRIISEATIELNVASSEMINLIKTELDDHYTIMERDFFEHLYKSIFDAYIQNIEGVYEHFTEVYIRDLTFTKSQQLSTKYVVIPKIITSTLFGQIKRKRGGIWDDAWDLAFYDNGEGNLINVGYYKITDDLVDYTNGNVKFTFLGDGFSHIINGEFTTDLSDWTIDTTGTTNVQATRVESETELGTGNASNDEDLEPYQAEDSYCLKITGNVGWTGDVNDNWITQELDLNNGETYEVELLVYAPSSNIASNGNTCRVAIGTDRGLTDIASKVFSTPADGNEDEWTSIVLSFTAGTTNYVSLFLNSTTVTDIAYYDKVIIRHTESDISWGTHNPGDDTAHDNGYLIEIYYQSEEDKNILLEKQWQIIAVDEENIAVTTEYIT